MKLSLVKKASPTAATMTLVDTETNEAITNSKGQPMAILVEGMQSTAARNAYLAIHRRLKPRSVTKAEKVRTELAKRKEAIEADYAKDDIADEAADALATEYVDVVNQLEEAATVVENYNASIGAEVLVGITVGWDNLEADDKPLKFTKENAKALYEAEDWIAAQVLSCASNAENFAPKM
jgi:hypothetical protein